MYMGSKYSFQPESCMHIIAAQAPAFLENRRAAQLTHWNTTSMIVFCVNN
jgi:hypothetical protein